MTLFEPTLQIRKIKVFRNDRVAYAETFHKGVNIIRGQNSSGKTTVIDLIAYSLGADNIAWKTEALLCNDVMAEVSCNGNAVTLRRAINDKAMNPMYIYWGPLEEAEKSHFSKWQLYPFRRSHQKESFSQVLFRALGMPEVHGDADSNVTMHQMLRLLYVDQRSIHSSIFRTETFDTVLTRETVGNYLCGIYDDRLYGAQLELRKVEDAFSKASSSLKSIFLVLGKSVQETNVEWVGSEIMALEREEADLSVRLIELRNSRVATVEKAKDPGLKNVRASLSKLKHELAEAEDKKTEIELDIEDSERFIRELEYRLTSLNEAKSAKDYLGMVRFSFCPCCLSAIEKAETDDACELCKTPLKGRSNDAQILRMRNELELQRTESIRLMDARVEELKKLDGKLPSLKSALRSLEKEYARSIATWTTELEQLIESTAQRLGEVRQKVAQLVEFQKIGNTILELQKQKNDLAARISELTTEIEKYAFAQESRKRDAKYAIATELKTLLRLDLQRQDEFINAEEVDWSFSENKVTVNGSTNFSESSMVILRHSFHLALLVASAKNSFFRIPRFLILDGIEDGGIELPRSYHFQKLIIETSKSLSTEHQIIFATSQINPELDHNDFVIGRPFTTENKSLSIG